MESTPAPASGRGASVKSLHGGRWQREGIDCLVVLFPDVAGRETGIDRSFVRQAAVTKV
jgi:hypothetical protein